LKYSLSKILSEIDSQISGGNLAILSATVSAVEVGDGSATSVLQSIQFT
jgi:hypothetical protein